MRVGRSDADAGSLPTDLFASALIRPQEGCRASKVLHLLTGRDPRVASEIAKRTVRFLSSCLPLLVELLLDEEEGEEGKEDNGVGIACSPSSPPPLRRSLRSTCEEGGRRVFLTTTFFLSLAAAKLDDKVVISCRFVSTEPLLLYRMKKPNNNAHAQWDINHPYPLSSPTTAELSLERVAPSHASVSDPRVIVLACGLDDDAGSRSPFVRLTGQAIQ